MLHFAVLHLRSSLKMICFAETKEPGQLDYYPLEPPCFVSVYDLFGTDVSKRNLYLSWAQALSDLEGCACLKDPQPLQVELMLADVACPVLALLDKLEAEGYVPQSKLITHSRHTGGFFDEKGAFPAGEHTCNVSWLPRLCFQEVMCSFDLIGLAPTTLCCCKPLGQFLIICQPSSTRKC